RQHFFQKRCFARAGTGNETDSEHASVAEALAQSARHLVVLFQDVLPNFEQPGRRHVSTSRATTSSSRPLTISGVAGPHLRQQSNGAEASALDSAQVGQ